MFNRSTFSNIANGAMSTFVFIFVLLCSFPLLFFPLYILDLPWWAFIILMGLDAFLGTWSLFGEPIAYIWALIVVLQGGFPQWVTVTYIIAFCLWALKVIAVIIEAISGAIRS